MPAGAGSLEICMAQKANMEAIFHSVADGIVTVDNELQVTNINHAAEAMLSVALRDAAGRPVGELLRGRVWDLGPVVEETRRTGLGVRERENVLAAEDGRDVRVLLATNRLIDRDESVAGAVVIIRDVTHLRELEVRLEERGSLHALTGRSRAMQEIFSLIEQVGPTDSTVLIQGESGTGKELVADAIHRQSRRASGPFVKVNCSALSEGLLESELFGHVKGAFTGALHDRKGRFELAQGGTIFLDEIGDLTERIQVKLLRVLQEREIERVGDTRTIRIDVRVLAATHQPLRRLVEEGRFRQDLFFRLNVIPLHLPALRERREDVPLLAGNFLAELASHMEKRLTRVSPDAMRVLLDHDWPGNVRELRNALEHAAVKCRGPVILVEDLPRDLVTATVGAREGGGGGSGGAASRPAPSAESEAALIRDALQRAGGKRGRAAELLGVDRTTLWRKMRKLGLA